MVVFLLGKQGTTAYSVANSDTCKVRRTGSSMIHEPTRWRCWLGAMVVLMSLGGMAWLLIPREHVLAQEPRYEVEGPVIPLTNEHTLVEVSLKQPDINLLEQSKEMARAKSVGCMHCHQGSVDPHNKATVRLGCTDCHGGDATTTDKYLAHVWPRHPEAWQTTANPVRSYTLLNHESPEFIRFVNPGDLRVARLSCGTTSCHPKEVLHNNKSMMTHGCMLWGAALYNNGAVPDKWPRYGESYSTNGAPQRLQTVPPPTEEEQRTKGVLPFLDPLPRFEISQPANVLRIFEKGGRFRPEVGIPERGEEPGRPRARLSNRGHGTENRTDPVFIGLQKTRLLDPTLNFLGTNDHPGDFRSSGCTACHMVYANDRSRVHSGPYARFGHRGQSFQADKNIPRDESGHPIHHLFAKGNSIPTSQCMVCHMHPGTTVMNTYLGFMWWDEETDGEWIYPKKQKYPTSEEFTQAQMANPNESAARNLLSNPEFLANSRDLNKHLKHTQFADFHGHGWLFRAVFRQDRRGNLLDHRGEIVKPVTNEKLQLAMRYQEQPPLDRQPLDGVPVHFMDIHLEKGMHCIDCHFVQDVHGNGRLQGEVRAAVEIQCRDCHGTIDDRGNLWTSGPAAYTSGKTGRNLAALRTPWGKPRFEQRGKRIIQNSMVEENLAWTVKQVMDTVDKNHGDYNPKAALAKTVRFEGNDMVWGDSISDIQRQGLSKKCAHKNESMSCIACHSAWNPTCMGCHLPQKANKKTPNLHNDGETTRNAVSYNFQTLREDAFMLAKDGDVTGNRIGPARSSCAVHVGSYNNNRESIYVQQQTVSAEGFSGIAFSTNVPHTVRGRDGTKQCTDCHLSIKNDNNAIVAQLLMQGTNYLNFMGRYCWVAAKDHGFFGVVVTERDEPQAVIGSSLHELAFPDYYKKHRGRAGYLPHAHEHPGVDIKDELLKPFEKPEVLAVQARGEYLYAACGKGGVRVFDIAFIDHKGFAERITTAPVSPAGQKFYVPTAYATSLAAPSTLAVDPTRTHKPENREQKVHPLYAYLYVTDKYEGLILIGAGTLLDGNPTNNFLKRDLTFNPQGILHGARSITIVGVYAYICCDAGLVVVSLEDPTKPKITRVLGEEWLPHPKAVQVQFRYGFVCDQQGVTVLDVTDLAKPRPVARLPLPEAHAIYVARTYAYVAAGKTGLIILDVENPEHPCIDQVFNADGVINDLHDVKLAITYVSEFAYLADGKNGLRVVQLSSPETPGNSGFAVRPTPKLVATYKIPHEGHALAVSEALDRDRAVDESGNQLSVFGRVGARPLNLQEQQKMYLRHNQVWRVNDNPFSKIYIQR